MDKIAESGQRKLIVPRGIDPERFSKVKNQKALVNAVVTEHGSVLVDCPYCIMYYRERVPVDVTRFVDTDREHKTECVKRGHILKFRPTGQWREERQKMGIQSR